MPAITVVPLTDLPQIRAGLSTLLVETVAYGGSVSFMHPLPLEAADAFWRDALASAARGERIVLGAFDGDDLVSTVTLLLNLPPNQPHRAEIAKMMTRVSHRQRGIATTLMRAAERLARELGRVLLVLDTAVDDGASTLYEGLGFNLTGVIPDYAFKPHGGLTGTKIYWKRIAEVSLTTRRDRQEIRRLEAGAADQRAVDVGDRHQFGGVRWLDRAAIEDADLGPLALEAIGQGIADKPVNLLDIGGRRGQPGTDRPDRLIGDHQIGRCRAIRQRSIQLAADRCGGSVRHRAAPASLRYRRSR